ncbi:hypothetical protein OIO90_000285 [Microbotryomycetes sp. JL221]|nr:hypothetical protein OIO90_000285 [Microbotryomycetes sp. JL221]
MNRFRRKSTGAGPTNSPKRKPAPSIDDDSGSKPSTPKVRQPPPAIPLLLPDSDTFRTSLILPELTQRFSLLKDGVAMTALQEHIESQRQAGSLTDQQADNVLEQIAAADADKHSTSSVAAVKPQRIDWRQLDKEYEALTADRDTTSSPSLAGPSYNVATSSSSTELPPTETLLASPFLSASAAQPSASGDRSNASSMFVDDPHSPSLVSSSSASFHSPMMSTSGWSLSPSSPLVRGASGGGGNSMFGGRVTTKTELKRNKSSGSLHSSASRKSAGSKRSGNVKGIHDSAPPQSPYLGSESPDPNVQATAATVAAHPASLSTMSPRARSKFEGAVKQDRRIDRALDEIEKQLFLEFEGDDDGQPDSDNVKGFKVRDTSPADRLKSGVPDSSRVTSVTSSPQLPGALPPSPSAGSSNTGRIRTSAVPLSPPKPRWSPAQPSSKQMETLSEAATSPVFTRNTIARSSPQRPPRPTYDKSPLSPVSTSMHQGPRTGPRTGSRTGVVASPATSIPPESPAGKSFVTGGSRSDAEQSGSDHDGPFDLSYGSFAEHRRGSAFNSTEAQASETLKDQADEEGNEDDDGRPGSAGSSYHPDDSDSDVMQARASLAGLQIQGLDIERALLASNGVNGATEAGLGHATASSARPDDSLLRVESEPMSRRPSDELLKTINDARPSMGEADLALRDLMMIQERLVRSASQRAASTNMKKHGSLGMERHGSLSTRSAKSNRRRNSHDERMRHSDGEARVRAAGQSNRVSEIADAESSPRDRLSRATGTTSVTGSSPMSASGTTPSTNHSDVFEFSSLVTSPVPSSFEEARDQLQRRQAPIGDGDSDFQQRDHEQTISAPSEMATPHAAAIFLPQVDDDRSTGSQAAEDEPPRLEPAVDEEVRVARGPLPPRNPAATQTMLVREVRNQATLATFALRKQSNKHVGRTKSVSKAAISAPRLLSGTSDIAAVPIANPEIKSPNLLPSPALGRKDSEAEYGSKGKGIGSRFRKLLKKQQSRDRLGPLNGDEVTPFDVSAEGSPDASPPFTPPDQAISRFDEASSPNTPATPQQGTAAANTSTPTGLPPVEEGSEQGSPATNSVHSSQSKDGGLSRLVSKLKRGSDRSKRGSESTVHAREGISNPYSTSTTLEPNIEALADGAAMSSTTAADNGAKSRQLIDQDRMGLGFTIDESARSFPSQQSSAELLRRFGSREQMMQEVAPLQPRRSSIDTAGSRYKHSSSSSIQTMAAPMIDQESSARGSRHRQTESDVSIDSMQRLWEAAEELGLPRDKVEELVNLSYAQSPTSDISQHLRGGSGESAVAGRSESGSDRHRHGSSSSNTASSSTRTGHTRGYSDVSARLKVTGSSESSQRVPSSPGSAGHRRHASGDGSSSFKLLRKMPSLHISNDKRISRTSSGLRAPVSPSDESFRSSYYANSVLDLYGSESSEGGDRQSRAYDDGEVVLAGRKFAEDGTPVSEKDSAGVWSIVNDLRRMSQHSATNPDASTSFASRPTSMDGDVRAVDALTQLLRHHKRNRSSTGSSIPSIPSNNTRFPSLYLRDEQRLLELGQEGGVADADKGRFYVRPVVRDEADLTSPDTTRTVEEFEFEGNDAGAGVSGGVRDERGFAV